MSAQLESTGVAGSIGPANSFHARLVLAAGVTASITAPTLHDLQQVVGKLQPTEAANEAAPQGNATKPAPTPAATAPAGAPAAQTTASSAPPAAAPAAQGDAGNASAAGAGQAASPASASTSSASPEASPASSVTFDELKKAFLALSQKAGGRALCEGVLASVEPKLGKLSEAKPEQYATLKAAIDKAAGG